MAEKLLSVGLDVGTTSTQMIVSQLEIENRASSFAVPEMEIAGRQILYESPVHFTPLLDASHVDGEKIRDLVEAEYASAGIRREDVDTGAVIITGETSRKENARAVLDALSDYAGDFVVATAGPDLESVLAARGAGAVEWSAQTGQRVIHMDIGGGTSNFCWIEDGEIMLTGCLNVGGRLVRYDETCTVTYVSPVLDKLCKLKSGDIVTEADLRPVADLLTRALEMAAGLREPTGLLDMLWTEEADGPVIAGQGAHWRDNPSQMSEDLRRLHPKGTSSRYALRAPRPFAPGNEGEAEPWVISFSGGVADCIGREDPWTAFGDMGPTLGQAIRESRLCRGEYRLGEQTIRATVIGAGCHSAQLSGSTVFYKNVAFPMKNLPVAAVTEEEQTDAARIRDALSRQEGERVALALPGIVAPAYEQVKTMAGNLALGFGSRPVILALEQDMAKALGHALALVLPPDREVLCIDSVRLDSHSYLDVGAPVGPALPIVVKTLILSK